jgi:adenosine deaminase
MAKDVRALPKGHLHYHLELCMRQSTLDALCNQHGVDRAATQLGTLPRRTANYDRGGGFGSFDEFSECAGLVLSLVRSADDLSRIILEMAADARADGVAYIEPSFGCAELYAKSWAASPRAAWDVGLAAGREAEARSGVVVRWMSPANRTRPVDEALAQARLAAELVATSEPVVASPLNHSLCLAFHLAGFDTYTCSSEQVSFGLHGSEGAKLSGEGPFPPEPFAEAFHIAASAGYVLPNLR